MKSLRFLALVLLLSLAAFATPSDPVGLFRLRLRGNSDTIVSLPLLRPPLAEAALAARAANDLTLSADFPALPDTGAFVLVMNGALEGAVLPIATVAGRTLSVSPGATDLSGLVAGDLLTVVPYWTLDALFPAGAGINPSASASARATEILLFNSSNAGINLSASATFYYFAGSQLKAAGWYQTTDASTLRGSQRLEPHGSFIVRHKIAGDTFLSLGGAVQMAAFRAPVYLRGANIDQDNRLGLPVPLPIRLADSGLIESGAFTPSASTATRADELLVFNNDTVAQNKSAAAIYFYFSGSQFKPAGWYKTSDTSVLANDFTLQPGAGFVIRKKNASSPRTDFWSALPTYLQ